ncbi:MULTISPECIES: sensor histidine kinase [Actinomadura]|uniref:histidine kinase n=1 Tax=Actinomadura madurae TaxID=1993 RepID=A0A1I5F8B6_9ACTN|nr:histidine kinase [Actinomadura madurae]SFO20015.1 Signal transduction histidine kinase [Actinomadura madurae]SPT60269.1 Oxygen sensor histidine kinase nreB [Actinomadura madurae]
MIDLRRIPDLWRRCPVVVRDLPFPLLLIVLSFVPALHGQETQVGDLPKRPFDALAAVILALETLPLAVRRRYPGASLALVTLGFTLAELGSYHMVAGTAIAFVLVSAGAHLDHHRRLAMVALTAVYVPLAITLHRMGSPEGVSGFVVFYLVATMGWCVGSWLRSTREAEAERRRRIAEATRTAERTRIARELHDVVTHHVTAMVVQTEAARYLTAAPDRLEETLSSISETGRRAIGDLRHLLDLLNPDHDTATTRAPSAGDLRTLVDQTRQAGQPVEFKEEGEKAESSGSAEFVTYRVVQEALTNALKYAHGSRTVVHVHYGDRDIMVEVGNDGSGTRAGSPGGSGRGLAGLRERVDALGGEFRADGRAGGGFVVRARIPARTS